MFSILMRRHPLEIALRRCQDLSQHVDRSQQLSGRRDRNAIQLVNRLKPLRLSFNLLQRAIQEEVKARSVYGVTSRQGVDQISSGFSRFMAALRNLKRNIDSVIPSRMAPPLTKKMLQDLFRSAKRLDAAVQELSRAVRARRIKTVNTRGQYSEEFVKVREAMATLNPKVAENLTGADVDPWCDWPGLDPENRQQVLRIAKLILATRVPEQEFELRYSSNLPGRPRLRMTHPAGFPTRKDLAAEAEAYKRPQKIYVVALKPTWRVMWVFDRDDVKCPW